MGLLGQAFLALVVVFDPLLSHHGINPDVAAECFSLTPAEAKVATRICSGLSVKDIAHTHHTSTNTVKSQLQRVLDKTGAKRQSDLIRLLLALPP